MEAIVQWLEELGLGRYGAAFVEADIDPAVLPDLNEADLQRLGVTLGHRKRLLRAIAALAEPGRPPPGPSGATSVPSPEAERRQLSVMFCDLVGSTALASRLDPEDLREVIGAYHRCCTDVIGQLGGFVAKYMGDGVLAYFGYPHAGEDDPERAVVAGLELVEAVRRIEAGVPLQARVGVASGLVVVGDLIGQGAAQEQAVVGETPNLAARLQDLAEPGMVVVGPRTRRLLGRLFDYRELGPVALKGFTEPQTVFAVLGRSVVESRFEARQEREVSPLIGRGAEMNTLLGCWRQVRAGEGRIVVLTGEPGIGKSRLAQEFQDRLRDEPHRQLRYFCSPRHQDSALYPFIARFERSAGFQREDEPPARRDKLDALLDRTGTAAEDRSLIAALLGLPDGGRDADKLTPQQRKRNTLDALIRYVRSPARDQPVLMLFEDVHWIDPTSLELLDSIAELVPSEPLLLLIAGRPEFEASWTGEPHVTTLALTRLEPRDCAALIGRIAGEPLPGSLVETIVQRSDGVPLFVEEITQAVLEAEPGAERSTSLIPTSLIASLTARLDRLGPAKEVAQIGALLGREFNYELLAAVAGRTDAELQASLERLTAAGLLFARGTPQDSSFLFKHALVQDAAHNTLLRSARRDWHARIAKAITSRFADTAQTQPALLAHHYTEAGLFDEAITWWERAAERARTQSANVEAANHLKIALALLGLLPDSTERAQREVRLRLRLVGPLVATTGLASKQSEDNYVTIAELTEQAGASLEVLRVLWGRSAMLLVRSDLDKAEELSKRFVGLATQARLTNGPCIGYRILGYAALLRGDIMLARQHFDASLRDYAREVPFVFPDYSIDLHSAMLCHEALLLQQEGFLDRASKRSAEAIAVAKADKGPTAEAYVLMHVALANMIAGDVQRAADAATSLGELTDRFDLGYSRWHAEVLLGWTAAGSGTLEEGIARIRNGLELRHRYMANTWVPVYLLAQAELLIGHGRFADAFPLLDESAALMVELQQHYGEPELHRLRAVALRATAADPAITDASFDRAIAAAQRRGAKLYELRAANCRAQFWQSAGRDEEARAMLAAVYAGFAEGFGCADLLAARALLARLATGR